ncbi:thioredoxin family protein [Bacillota bacterium Lsc_1132]
MMKEWNQDELNTFFIDQSTGLVYFYTPLCGTCQVASKMLLVIEEMLKTKIGKMNLNFFPETAKNFSVESVPCLLFVKNGEVVETIYAFHSVPYLLEKINQQLN